MSSLACGDHGHRLPVAPLLGFHGQRAQRGGGARGKTVLAQGSLEPKKHGYRKTIKGIAVVVRVAVNVYTSGSLQPAAKANINKSVHTTKSNTCTGQLSLQQSSRSIWIHDGWLHGCNTFKHHKGNTPRGNLPTLAAETEGAR